MGQVLHGSARTTAAVRRAIQHRQESLNTLAERYASIQRPWRSGSGARTCMMRRWGRSTTLHGADERTGSDVRRVSQAYAAAAG